MLDVRYRPAGPTGSWRAAVSATALVVLAPEVSAHAAEAVWRRLDGGGIAAVLDALTGAFGTSLAAIPPFALVMAEGQGVRVAVRGPLELVVETDAGTESVSGAGVATWVERFLPDVRRVAVETPAGEGTDERLPIAAGVVAVAAVELGLSGADVPGDARAVPAAEPVAVAAPAEPDAPVLSAPEAEPVPAESAQADPEPVVVEPPAPAAPDIVSEVPSARILETIVPDATALAPVPPAPPTPGAEEAPAAADAPSEDELWGETIAVPPRPAAPEPVPAPPAPASEPPAGDLGDHDGATISVAEFRALKEAGGSFESTESVPVRSQGRIRVSDGRAVELDRTVVFGRRPRSTRPGADLPALVAVDGPQHDISRNHVEVRAEGEHILAVDLASTNGTVLLRGGQDPVRLHPHEPTIIVDGDVLDLGDGVTLTFEGLA